MKSRIAPSAALVAALLCSGPAQAQLFRAYLSPTGVDTNACTLAAPCRLLPAALAAAADGGEVWMLDSANYNTATVHITKSVKILAVPGVVGSIVATGGPAISINTAGVKASLRNIVIVPLPGASGTDGIDMNGGDSLTVDGSSISGLSGNGIHVSTPAVVRVSNSTLRDNVDGIYLNNGAKASVTRSNFLGNSGSGIQVAGYAAGTTTSADVGDSTFAGNGVAGINLYSVDATGMTGASVRDCLFTRGDYGVFADSEAGGASTVTIVNSTITQAAISGITAGSFGTKVWVRGSTIAENLIGFTQFNSAVFESAGDNALRLNTSGHTSGTITTAAPM